MTVWRAGRLGVVLAFACGGTSRQPSSASPKPACMSTAASSAAANSYTDSSDSWTSIDSMKTRIHHVDFRPGIQSISSGLADCRQRHVANGVVKVRIAVAPAGCVQDVRLVSTPDPGLGECVVAVVRSAVFPETDLGGTLAYRF